MICGDDVVVQLCSCICSIIALFYPEKYGEGQFKFTSAWLYLMIINNISQIVSYSWMRCNKYLLPVDHGQGSILSLKCMYLPPASVHPSFLIACLQFSQCLDKFNFSVPILFSNVEYYWLLVQISRNKKIVKSLCDTEVKLDKINLTSLPA